MVNAWRSRVEVLAWESFGRDWLNDVVNQLKIDPITHVVPYGQLPDLEAIDFANDVLFTWNGTTSGLKCRMVTGYQMIALA